MRARTSSTREYESPIHSFRVDNGLTLKELAKKTGTSINTICDLASGAESPIDTKTFNLKKSAQRLCDFFKVPPDVLFPRYVCSLDRGNDAYVEHVRELDSLEKRLATEQCDIIESRILLCKLIELSGMTNRQSSLVAKYYINGYSLRDLAEEYGVTHARIRAIIREALFLLRSGPARAELRKRRVCFWR